MTAGTAEQPPAVEKPKHKLSELTTYELRDYRQELEKAISFVDNQRPAPAPGWTRCSPSRTTG
jgi:hypothetical protein